MSIDLERNLIGLAMTEPDGFMLADPYVATEDFYQPEHREIWEAMLQLSKEDTTTNLVNVTAVLRRRNALHLAGGASYVSDLVAATEFGSIEEVAKALKHEAEVRRLHRLASLMMSMNDRQQIVEAIQSEIDKIIASQTGDRAAEIASVVQDVVHHARSLSEGTEPPRGIRTGFKAMDFYFSGLQPGDLFIIAARPGVGKSALATNIVKYVAIEEKKNVLFVSLEMTNREVVERIISDMAEVNSMSFKNGRFNLTDAPNDIERIEAARNQIFNDNVNLVLSDSGSCTVADIKLMARKMKRRGGLDLIVVDYLQLISGKGQNRNDVVGGISKGLKTLAKDLEIPIIALSQLKRGENNDEREEYSLSDLRESGDIEQDADKIVFLVRKIDKTPRIAKLQIGKHRGGPIGTEPLRYTPEYTRFEDGDWGDFVS